jgi:hypothetical protein
MFNPQRPSVSDLLRNFSQENSMDEPEQPNGPITASKHKKPKWTVLVYLAGDNNLTANCITVLQQLEAVKYKEDICVLACFDSNTPWPKGSRYLAINCNLKKDNDDLDWAIHNDLIRPQDREHKLHVPDFCRPAALDEGQNATPLTRTNVAEGLIRFLKWATKMHSDSDHLMLIFYGHGPVVGGQTFLARENPPSSLQFGDLQLVLKDFFGEKKRIDILAFQNCVMNGIETAYEVQDYADYLIGSQGLVLAAGWPYEKLISHVVNEPDASPKEIAEKMLKSCARHLIDFTVMDRSSEQAVTDLSKLRGENNVTDAILKLVGAMKRGLTYDEVASPDIFDFPQIIDAIRLARLEAQAFWGETFVDIYDFCERLLKTCNRVLLSNRAVIRNLNLPKEVEEKLQETELTKRLRKIGECCVVVMDCIKEMVPYSYYIGSELQYSHGLSIYFPWSWPVEPYSFTQVGSEFVLKTGFEIYKDYSFVRASGWASFLKDFYRATLRKVRRAERNFTINGINENVPTGMINEHIVAPALVLTPSTLQKSDSNTGPADANIWSNVKNYPRRNYVSVPDCARKVETGNCQRVGSDKYPDKNSPPVSYLGWNVCDLLADVIKKQLPDGEYEKRPDVDAKNSG